MHFPYSCHEQEISYRDQRCVFEYGSEHFWCFYEGCLLKPASSGHFRYCSLWQLSIGLIFQPQSLLVINALNHNTN